MSVDDATYGRMLENSHRDSEQVFWIEEILEEASSIYGEVRGVNTGIEQAQTLSDGYEAYVLENTDLDTKVLGFEVRPLYSSDFGTGFALRPEETGEEYDEFKQAIYQAIDSELSDSTL